MSWYPTPEEIKNAHDHHAWEMEHEVPMWVIDGMSREVQTPADARLREQARAYRARVPPNPYTSPEPPTVFYIVRDIQPALGGVIVGCVWSPILETTIRGEHYGWDWFEPWPELVTHHWSGPPIPDVQILLAQEHRIKAAFIRCFGTSPRVPVQNPIAGS